LFPVCGGCEHLPLAPALSRENLTEKYPSEALGAQQDLSASSTLFPI